MAMPRRRVVDPSWSPELAYACGLMATDGCLLSDGRHLNLTSNDLDQLETFQKCLGIKTKISWKPSGYSKKLGSQVQFGDVTLYDWFVSIGIKPRKTMTLGVVAVPDNFFFDYLRGEFDGDGYSHAYWDTRWRSSVSLYIGFTCGSRKHLEWLNQTVARLIGISGYIQPMRTIHRLMFSKTRARELYRAMYYNQNIPFLARKKEKLDRQWEAVTSAQQKIQPKGFIKHGSVLRIA